MMARNPRVFTAAALLSAVAAPLSAQSNAGSPERRVRFAGADRHRGHRQ